MAVAAVDFPWVPDQSSPEPAADSAAVEWVASAAVIVPEVEVVVVEASMLALKPW